MVQRTRDIHTCSDSATLDAAFRVDGIESRRNLTGSRVPLARLTALGCSEAASGLTSVLGNYHGLDTYRNIFVDCGRETLLTVMRQVRHSMPLHFGRMVIKILNTLEQRCHIKSDDTS